LSEPEKITINLGLVDLGQIDLLVQEGFYQNRTDFIRTAIRNQLNAHAEAVKQTVARKELVLGLQHYARSDLEAVRDAGETLEIRVLGLASIADGVPPELALETIDFIRNAEYGHSTVQWRSSLDPQTPALDELAVPIPISVPPYDRAPHKRTLCKKCA
jgi:Arc/MetJ-type ribon-helix-helix transcriptional regulator